MRITSWAFALPVFSLLTAACAVSPVSVPGSPGELSSDAGAADAAPPRDTGTEAAPSLLGEAGSTGTQCQRTLAVGKLTISNAGCFVNQHVEDQTTTLLFPCVGGAATAVFGGHTFAGTVAGDTVSLHDVEPFDFNACPWESTETISGNLGTGSVTYSYTERPLAACQATPCTAGGALQVSAGEVTVVK